MKDITHIIQTAKKTIFLSDNFIDEGSFKVLSKKNRNVSVKIYSNNALAFNPRNVKRRNDFKDKLRIFFTSHFTDRFLIIDEKFMFLLSRPVKDNNKKGFEAIRMMDYSEIERQIIKMQKCEENCRRYGWHRK